MANKRLLNGRRRESAPATPIKSAALPCVVSRPGRAGGRTQPRRVTPEAEGKDMSVLNMVSSCCLGRCPPVNHVTILVIIIVITYGGCGVALTRLRVSWQPWQSGHCGAGRDAGRAL